MNFETVASEWLASLVTKSTPVRRSTIKSYSSILRTHLLPRFRNVSLEELVQSNNRALRELVKDLRDRYKPASLQLFCQVFDSILAFPVDDNGTRLFRCERNNAFVDLPAVVPAEQRSPAISAEELQTVVASHRYSLLFATLAGTGCRISELLALKQTDWNREDGILFIRAGKTAAAIREIDLCSALNEKMRSAIPQSQERLFPHHLTTLRNASRGVTGAFHSMRRFRLTHLRRVGCNEDILRMWLGHSDRTISDRYSRLKLDRVYRRKCCEDAGLGFTLPEHRVADLVARAIEQKLAALEAV